MSFVDKNGERLCTYRKTHLWDPFHSFERRAVQWGSDLPPIIEFMGIKIGLLICWDVEFPENCRSLVLHGAQLILSIAANCDSFVLSHIVRVRAFENLTHLVYCNAPAEPFCGASSVCAPTGDVLLALPRDEACGCVALNLHDPAWDGVRQRNPFFQFRMPGLYGALAQ